MRKGTIITTSILGGVLVTALVAGGSFALGSGINDNENSPQGAHNGQTMNGPGRGAMGNGQGPSGMQGNQGSSTEMTDGLAGLESGTLTSEQETTLALMAEEEKLAHDLYVTFGDLYGDTVFDRVSGAETKHLTAVQTMLERYNLADPTAGMGIGEFSSESMQTLYDSLLAQGTASRDGAYEAARTVERTDIIDLNAAMEGLSAPDVLAVYGHLLSGSEHHLAAFGG